MQSGYKDIVLGQSVLPPSCEEHFVGVREGQETTFEFTCPEDYLEPKLRNKTVKIWAKIYKVLNSVKIASLDQLKMLNIRNHYHSLDLNRLSKENDILYHLVLTGAPEHDLAKMPIHFLMHVYHCAKLHKTKDFKRLAELLTNNKEALEAFADDKLNLKAMSLGHWASSWDNLWDSYCEVRKA